MPNNKVFIRNREKHHSFETEKRVNYFIYQNFLLRLIDRTYHLLGDNI
jgi:hypothetical protein